MKFLIISIISFLFLISIKIHKADIPTHCLTSQVIGKWVFKSIPTKPYNDLKSLYTLKCGIKNHVSVSSIYKQYMNEKLFTQKFEVELKKDMTAILTRKGKKIVRILISYLFIYEIKCEKI